MITWQLPWFHLLTVDERHGHSCVGSWIVRRTFSARSNVFLRRRQLLDFDVHLVLRQWPRDTDALHLTICPQSFCGGERNRELSP